MAEPLYDSEGNMLYGGRGRKPKHFWARAEEGEFFRKVDGELVQFWQPDAPDTREADIKEYLEAQQEKTRNNCRTCKNFTIPVDNWPHKKLWGHCTLKNEETKASWDCKDFCRPGELTAAEEWDSKSASEKKKIIAAEKKAKKAYVAMKNALKKADPKNPRWPDLFKTYDKLIDANAVMRAADTLNRILERIQDPEASARMQKHRANIKKKNRKAAAEFLGIGYKPRKDCFVFGKKQKRTIGGITLDMKNKGEEVECTFVMGEGWKLEYNGDTFGPCPI